MYYRLNKTIILKYIKLQINVEVNIGNRYWLMIIPGGTAETMAKK